MEHYLNQYHIQHLQHSAYLVRGEITIPLFTSNLETKINFPYFLIKDEDYEKVIDLNKNYYLDLTNLNIQTLTNLKNNFSYTVCINFLQTGFSLDKESFTLINQRDIEKKITLLNVKRFSNIKDYIIIYNILDTENSNFDYIYNIINNLPNSRNLYLVCVAYEYINFDFPKMIHKLSNLSSNINIFVFTQSLYKGIATEKQIFLDEDCYFPVTGVEYLTNRQQPITLYTKTVIQSITRPDLYLTALIHQLKRNIK